MTTGHRYLAAALAATAWLACGWGFEATTLTAQPAEGQAPSAESAQERPAESAQERPAESAQERPAESAQERPADGFDRQALVEAAIVARADGRFDRLDGYLRFLAKRLDFYFTIEEGPRRFYSPGIADSSATTLPVDVASIDDLVARLNEALDGVKVFRSETLPNVVHLVSKKLLDEAGATEKAAEKEGAAEEYSLDRRVSFDRFEGRLNLLPSRVGDAAGGGLTAWSVGVPPDYVGGDSETKIAVSATDRTVRDVLTAAVPGVAKMPLEGVLADVLPPDEDFPEAPAPPAIYDRLLWTAQQRASDSPLVQVRYSGPELNAEERAILAGQTGFDFRAYLPILARKLDFHYTVEDGTPPGGDSHLLWEAEEIAVPADLDSIDAFVAWANENVDGIAFFRNEKIPKVVHVVAKHLLVDDSVMNERIAVRRFVGELSDVARRVSVETDGRIQPSTGGVIGGDLGDYGTQTTLDVENETVRNVLTAAAPLEDRRRYLWEAISEEGPPTVVKFRSRDWSDENYLLMEYGLIGYLKEMGNRLDCYFTFEDQGDGYENWRRAFHYSPARGDLDFDIRSIDELVESLDDVLNRRYVYDETRDRQFAKRFQRVRVVRSEKHPRVIHLIEKGQPIERYVLDRRIDFGFHGKLDQLPRELKAIDRRLDVERRPLPGGPNHQPIDEEFGGELPNVKVGARDVTVREALTLASPLDGHRRIIWRASSFSRFGEPETLIHYFGTFDTVAGALGYDENPAPKLPVDPRAQDPFAQPARDPFQ
jgi:hypothetical protein